MTDPLSISASIAGLITLADIVFCRICNYAKAVKNASKDVLALRSEVDSLYVILTKLRLLSIQLDEDEAFEAAFRTHHVHSCHEILEKIRQVLEKSETAPLKDRHLQSFKRKLQWPFKSSEVEAFISEIERHKQTLSLALNVDSMSGLLQALSRQNDLRGDVQDIKVLMKEKLEAESRIAIDKDRQQVLESFEKADPRRNLDTSRKLRHAGTGLWLTEGSEFQKWLDTESARLWLYGIPGAGKTVLAASVIDEALRIRNSNTAVAFFFCDYKDHMTQEAYAIMGSLAQQIAKHDEQCFEKLQGFYQEKNPEHRRDIFYSPTDLANLITEMMSNLDRTVIIVDGLDECGRNTRQIVEILAGLGDGIETDCKKLFLSRNEVEIREQLGSFEKIPIAARSGDLKLYVAAEIELRTRKKKLRIKDDSLREYIMKQLVEGADGMFRWVTCQMDYLCELPNDAARRKALVSLPPDLNSTYERILRRVNQSNTEVQRLVQRTLRWIVHGHTYPFPLRIDALSESLSVEVGDSRLNSEAIPDEFEILHWCSSLVRKSVDGHHLELAHFTVKEFLMQISRDKDNEFQPYGTELDAANMEMAETCLTYLNFEDFTQEEAIDEDAVQSRLEKYPFREYAVENWRKHASDHCGHDRLFPLLKKLFHPSKHNTLISLVSDRIWLYFDVIGEYYVSADVKSAIAEANSLHFAAMECVPELCAWLIQSGCDVNKETSFGTPLCCVFLHHNIDESIDEKAYYSEVDETQEEVLSILLEAQEALTTGRTYSSGQEVSPLWLAISTYCSSFTLQLLERGYVLDCHCINLLAERFEGRISDWVDESLYHVLEHASDRNLREEDKDKFVTLVSRAEAAGLLKSCQERYTDGKLSWSDKVRREMSLYVAAEFGRKEIIVELLKDCQLDVNAAQPGTGMTAVHYAAANDHAQILEILLKLGGNPGQIDSKGRTALHHACSRRESVCVFVLLQHTSKFLQSKEETLQPLASSEGDCHSTSRLSSQARDSLYPDGQNHSSKTALVLAAENRNINAIELLLSHGCNPNATDDMGFTIIHHACHLGLENIFAALKDSTTDWNSRVSTQINGFKRHNVTVLHLAAAEHNSGLLEYLLREDLVSDINGVTDCAETALNIAAWSGCPRNVSLLLSRGADATIVARYGRHPIHMAAIFGHHEIVRLFLDHGCDARIKDSNGLDTELIALKHRHHDLAEFLDKYARERGHQPVIERTTEALKIAINAGDIALCKRFVNEGANIDHGYCVCQAETPLLYSLEKAQPTIAEYLVLEGASAKGRTCDRWETRGYSAFHYAASMNYPKVLEALLERKAREFVDLDELIHPIHLAVANGYVKCVELMMAFAKEKELLYFGKSSVNFSLHHLVNKSTSRIETSWEWFLRPGFRFPRNFFNSSPLHIAAGTGNIEIARLLLNHGASVDSMAHLSGTPLHFAAANGFTVMIDLLLDAGANPNSQDYDLKTSSMLAALRGDLRSLRALVGRGSDLRLRNLSGSTVLHLAAFSNSPQTIAFLLNRTTGHELCVENYVAQSALTRNYISCPSLMLNFAPSPSAYIPQRGNIISYAVAVQNAKKVQMLLRRLPEELVPTLLHQRNVYGTPLYSASTVYMDIKSIQLLLDAGADLELEGGDHGTPLMGACATGRLEAVKILIAKGANTSYSKDGETTSALRAAKNHPMIARWLLVGRFMEMPRLITSG